MVDTFYVVINAIINRFTPSIPPTDDKYPKWFTSKIIELINEKNYYHDQFKKTQIPIFNNIYKKSVGN